MAYRIYFGNYKTATKHTGNKREMEVKLERLRKIYPLIRFDLKKEKR